MGKTFADQVYAYVLKIPPGKVTTYGDIARALHRPAAARAVGNALNRNPDPFFSRSKKSSRVRREVAKRVPCHRVVHSDLTIGGYSGGLSAKRQLLAREGVAMTHDKVGPTHVIHQKR